MLMNFLIHEYSVTISCLKCPLKHFTVLLSYKMRVCDPAAIFKTVLVLSTKMCFWEHLRQEIGINVTETYKQ